VALVKRTPASFAPAPPAPDPNAPVEPASDNQAGIGALTQRLESHDLTLAPMYGASIAGMCRLSRQYGFVLDVVWAPMPPLVAEGRKKSGQLASLDNQLKAVFAANGCQTGPIYNMNDVQTFTNFDGGAFHLRGSGWQQRAAGVLRQYIQALPGVSQKPASLSATGQASDGAVARAGL
jgi:hypothetical protein